jgi:hypothetical protein
MTTLLIALGIVTAGPKAKDAPATIARTMAKYGHTCDGNGQASGSASSRSLAGLTWSKYPERWELDDDVLLYDVGSREIAEIQGESALAATPKEGLCAVTAGRFYHSGPQMRVGAVSQTTQTEGLHVPQAVKTGACPSF